MNKHTPAPWFVRETGDHYSKRNDIYVIGNPDGSLGGDRKLAMLIDTWAEEQTIHNARLIAAAPELLEALQDLLEQTGIDGWYADKAKTAIRKATGG